MPGNEIDLTKKLVEHIGQSELPHLGLIESVGAPKDSVPPYVELHNEEDVDREVGSDNARKKADVYINGHGVSLKQEGGSISFNRLQRSELPEVLTASNFDDVDMMLNRIDTQVRRFHNGELGRRGRPWSEFFTEDEFKILLKYLMMRGSPNYGTSAHPAEYIIEAPRKNIMFAEIKVHTYDEYFEHYKDKLIVSIRRVWIGQRSDSEHGRAVGLVSKPGNAPWVFDNVSGRPRSGWREEIPEQERKTVFFLMMEKKA